MSRNKLQSKMFSGIMIVKIAATCAASWLLASLAGSNHPYLAPTSVILCMKPTIMQSVRFTKHRLFGTLIGTAFIALVYRYFPVNGWTIGLFIFVGIWAAKLLGRSNIVMEQVALTILLVFVFEHKSNDYLVDRLKDSAIGTILALVVHLYVFPTSIHKEVVRTLKPFTDGIAAKFAAFAGWAGRGCPTEEGRILESELQSFQKLVTQTENRLQELQNSLRFYRFSAKKTGLVQGYAEQWKHWKRSFEYMLWTRRKLEKRVSDGPLPLQEREAWAAQLAAFGSYFTEQSVQLSMPTDKELPPPDTVYVKPVPLVVTAPAAFGGESQPYDLALYLETSELANELR